MKHPLFFPSLGTLAAVLFFSSSLFAQEPETAPPAATPETTPEPAAETAATPEPEPTPPPAPTPRPTPPPTPKEILNALSTADLQEALALLKANYIHPGQLGDEELSRALLEGIMARLGPGVTLLATPDQAAHGEPHPFLAEILDERIGYVRLGALSPDTLGQLDAALQQFGAKELKAAVLDLRGTPTHNDLELAVEVIKRFVPKGKLLFTVRKPSEKQERIFTSNQEPAFIGLTMILVDRETAGSPEIIAAAIRAQTRSMVLGEASAGRAVEYEDRKLKGGQILRIAVAEIAVPDRPSIFPDGVVPDLVIPLDARTRDEIFRQTREKGVSQFVFDRERPRMNEAALIAGTLPELDAYQEEQRSGESPSGPPRDTVLQRAVDLITTISIYESN